MLESLPQKTECSKGAESALKKPPKTKRSKEKLRGSLWSVCFFWEGKAERPKKQLERHWDFGNATSRAKDSTYVTDD